VTIADGEQKHFPVDLFYDVIGQGFRIECNCGEQTCPCQYLEEAGAEMDEHMNPVEEVA
jgi:hypothetical protein